MPNKDLEEASAIVNDLINSEKNKGLKDNPLLENFVKIFYQYSPSKFLKENDSKALFNSASNLWDFIFNSFEGSVKEASPRKVRVFNPDKSSDNWESNRTIVELNTTDSPFILDSVTAELTKLGYNIYAVMHPVISIDRNDKGDIVNITNSTNSDKNLESVMHIQISYIADISVHKDIEKNILNILSFVSFAVTDWHAIRNKTSQLIKIVDKNSKQFEEEYVSEVKDFLSWILANNFIFLGYQEYGFSSDDKDSECSISVIDGSELGIFRAENISAKPSGLKCISADNVLHQDDNVLLEITKSNNKSIIHRPVSMDYVGIKHFDENNNLIGESRILGLFTSSVYYQSAMTIPIIRKKIDTIVERSGLTTESHSSKALLTVLESYPRDEMLQVKESDLFNISMGMVELAERPRTKLFVRKDRFSRFMSCLVFVPKEQFNTNLRENIQNVLEDSFNGEATDYYTQVTESPLARIHVIIALTKDSSDTINIKEIERRLVEITNSWNDELRNTLISNTGERKGEELFTDYSNAFPEVFKNSYHFGGTYCDIKKIEESYTQDNLTLDIYHLEKDPNNIYQLKIYQPAKKVTLSEILPILENMGFDAIDERTFFIEPKHHKDGTWVHHFALRLSESLLTKEEIDNLSLISIKDDFETALYKIWHDEIENDALNKLILIAGLTWRDVEMLRAYGKYIRQTDFTYSLDYMLDALSLHPRITKLLLKLFNARFDPSLLESDSVITQNKTSAEIDKSLSAVSNIAEDRVIRQFYETILCTLRTNFFQLDKNGENKSYISYKFDSQSVPNLPLPRMHVEIFVYSRDIEGIHLRGGKVARGGLRWSDRVEDFRTEVLGLVKAQMVKNSVIVPVGSKGGFVVKYPDNSSREAWLDQGKECYKIFLSGLLDITDNIIDGKIIPPREVVRQDEDDPYLVVAADKGTATFSDIANNLATDYGFWLGDAFASGGSVGYDHKKMGITAKGAWVSVKRHFMEMGINCQEEDFTCVGIGDMSGDVFGNGMLLSEHIRLVGAFNHMHIFVDPTPDSATSYKERKRLFELPRSTWLDYNKDLITKGGGIFDRTAKSIDVSKEMAELFNIDSSSISPDELIKKMLTSKVDLIWNGGIGTYVKSEIESHEFVGDKANDALRINAKELNCKVIGEGGNLGLTQRSRIEASSNGVRINTDAIDNSAGVDCSDHEVNIKIALQDAVSKETITIEERNKILEEMTDEVSQLVLRDNELQTQAITIAELEGVSVLEQKNRLMNFLTDEGLLDRRIEFLPDEDNISHNQTVGRGLTRPEISVLLAYSKMSVYNDLIASNMPDDKYFTKYLVSYFPSRMQEEFPEEISEHQLKREIITTCMSNEIVNRMGCTFFHRMRESTGMKGCDVVRSYAVARDLFNIDELWDEVESLDGKIELDVQIQLYIEIRDLISHVISWFLRNGEQPIDATDIIEKYSDGINEIKKSLDSIMSTVLKNARDAKFKKYTDIGLPENISKEISNLEALSSACDIVSVARQNNLPVELVGKIYFEMGFRFNFGWLRLTAYNLMSDSHWDNLSLKTIIESLFDQQMMITAEISKEASCNDDECNAAIESWYSHNVKNIERYDKFITDIKSHDTIKQSMLTVAIQRSKSLCN